MAYLLPFTVFFPILGGVISYIIGRFSKPLRDIFLLLCVLITMAMAAILFQGEQQRFFLPGFCGLGLSLRSGGFHSLMALLTGAAWFVATLLSREYFAHTLRRNRYYLFWLMTLGATLGVFFSDDLFTTFIFFEVMSFTSFVFVVQTEQPDALRAGDTYLAVAVIGGLVTLTGLFILYDLFGTLSFDAMRAAVVFDRGKLWWGGVLALVGFAAKAGAFPLHIWLPTAHPAAPAPASAVLSGIVTKTGVYGVLALSTTVFLHDEGWGLLMAGLGAVTMVLGAVLALCCIDLKRALACSSVSQIGFLFVAIAMQCLLGSHNGLAVDGTILHLLNHTLVKLILFPAAGILYLNLHTFDLNKLRGCGRGKPLLAVIMALPMLSLAGVPGLSGYLGKTLIHESIVELIHTPFAPVLLFTGLEWLFLLTGGLTTAYMLKLYLCIFVEAPPLARPLHNSKKKGYIAPLSAAILLVCSLLMPLLGLWPDGAVSTFAAYAREFFLSGGPEHSVHWFAWINLKGALISLAIGAGVYRFVVCPFFIRRGAGGEVEYLNPIPTWLNLEERVYRPGLTMVSSVLGFFALVLDRLFFRLVFSGIPAAASWATFAAQSGADRLSYRLTGQGFVTKLNTEQQEVDPHFGRYQDKPPAKKGFFQSLAFGLLLAGVGLALAILFILLPRI